MAGYSIRTSIIINILQLLHVIMHYYDGGGRGVPLTATYPQSFKSLFAIVIHGAVWMVIYEQLLRRSPVYEQW